MTIRRPCKKDLPDKLYMLWDGDSFVKVVHSTAASCGYIACESKEDAVEECKHQLKAFGVECVPVRVR